MTDNEREHLFTSCVSYLAQAHSNGKYLSKPQDTKAFLQLYFRNHQQEVFGCIHLDNRNRILDVEDMFFGTINGAAVYPREVVRSAIKHNTGAIIFYHNHPSGVAEPSSADRDITRRLQDALTLIDVRVVDHLVVGVGSSTSMAERGLM